MCDSVRLLLFFFLSLSHVQLRGGSNYFQSHRGSNHFHIAKLCWRLARARVNVRVRVRTRVRAP